MHKLCLPMKGTSLGNLALNTALASNLSEVIVITNFLLDFGRWTEGKDTSSFLSERILGAIIFLAPRD
ncbi:hypothetical protein ACFQDF_12265 [Ectobacillus funiculus]